MNPSPQTELAARYAAVRHRRLDLAAPLSPEDQCVQPMPEASPTQWHLAHTTWFFETLVLAAHAPGHRPYDARWAPLFSSCYESLGPRHPRPQHGLLTRPSLAEVHAYRAAEDTAVQRLIAEADEDARAAAAPLIEPGQQQEQQHQELLLTDIQYALAQNPLAPALRPGVPAPGPAADAGWVAHAGGEVEVGHAGAGFGFDNGTPRHAVRLAPFAIGRRLVTNAEFQPFVDNGGDRRPALWLTDGWAAPLYWRDGGRAFGLHGEHPRRPDEPVLHLSVYEAAAHAEWAGAVGEYNGKCMVGQIVLRGFSAATPPGHARLTHRNFFPPAARWQFSGLRLARDL